MKKIQTLMWCLLAGSAMLAAADAPYVGKWKMDAAKSDFGDTSITFAQAQNGSMQMTFDGQTYTFKTDGKDYDGMFGSKMSWKVVDPSTWEVTSKMGAKVLSVDTYKLAADSKTLNVVSKGTSPAGKPFENNLTYQRVTGTTGLGGKWKTKNLQTSLPALIELAASGTDGLSFKMPDQKMVCDAKLDGKQYPCTGPDLPPNTGVAFKKAGANAVSADITIGGRLAYQSTYTAAADGKTLTETGGAVGTTEKYKVHYDRQ